MSPQPTQDAPTQNAPTKVAPTQNAPTQDAPTQDAPTKVVPGVIETRFRSARADGRKVLVPFVTAGVCDDWVDIVRACADGGADAIEIGIPFSDPVMDGPVIQQASVIALNRGTTPLSIVVDLRHADVGVPLVAMTSFNIAYRMGDERFASLLVEGGFAGLPVGAGRQAE